ncbi:MAG: hypothetical protein IKV61_03255 [Clostridia bacterium]|nr:hypothetical protein [Clostridia bacterium]
MKKITTCIFLILLMLFSLVACTSDSLNEPTVTVDSNGYVVINGIKTEYKVEQEPEIAIIDGYIAINGVKSKYKVETTPTVTVDSNGYVVINGIKTEYKVEQEPEITVIDGYIAINGVKSKYKVETTPTVTVDSNGYVVINGIKTEYKVEQEPEITVIDGYIAINGQKTEYLVKESQEESGKTNAKYMHLSFDDVTLCFQNLTTQNYESLFEEPFFANLKSLHNEYGAKFSLFTYNSTLNNVPNKYASEFIESSDWLKIGFHSNSSGFSLATSTYAQGESYWNTFVNNVERVCGTTSSLDRMPRLEYFAGSKDALLGMKNANLGAMGFLSADDNRLSYYFNDSVMTYLYDNDYIIDSGNNLLFLSTDIRGDWFYNFTTNNVYRKPLKNNVLSELEYRNNNNAFLSSFESLIIFTHEWLVYNGTTVNSKIECILGACEFAKENSLEYDFPQNRVYENCGKESLFNVS